MSQVKEQQNTMPNPPTDGLTKKERRALRIQGKEKPLHNVSGTQSRTETDGTSLIHKVALVKVPNVSEVKEGLNKAQLKAERRAAQEAQRGKKENVEVKVLDDNIVTPVVKQEHKEEGVNKAELKAQRRAIQEAQRIAKLNLKPQEDNVTVKMVQQESTLQKKAPKKPTSGGHKVNKHKVQLFNHLYFEKGDDASTDDLIRNLRGVHPAFLKLGVQYSSKTIVGSNARCLALLSTLKQLIADYSSPPKQEFCRSLETVLQSCISYLQQCRPLAVSMTNALIYFKLHLTQIDTNLSDDEKKVRLADCIETYIVDEIQKAGEAISISITEKISDDDVILTYGCSSLIKTILLDAHEQGKNFKVIVVDTRPMLEGKEMLRKLVSVGIQCTYMLINGASFIMNRATKVLLGAHALLANGYVMSRTGTAQIALIARAYNKPVLVCCETYKFCERVQTDSFVYNEIGDPDSLVVLDNLEERSALSQWKKSNHLTPLNLMYDVTPPHLVTAVVTELAFLPCTSVPVILRIRPTEIA